jgi:hypothetical protein
MLTMGDKSVLTNDLSDVDFFLDELCRMLISNTDPDFRNVHIRTMPAANHKTLAAFLLTGPALPDSSNVENEFSLEMLQKPGGARSVAFLSSVASHFVGGSTMKDVALAEAGPGRWVSLITTAKAPAAVGKQKNVFRDFTGIMGPEWGHSTDYIAVSMADLGSCLKRWFAPPEVRPDTIGYLAVKAAVHGHRSAPVSALQQVAAK